MAVVVMADDGIPFDGRTRETAPLGGAEAAFTALAESLAALGHQVLVGNRCAEAQRHRGVEWQPLARGLPDRADLYIANRGHRLIGLVPKARRRIFWIHNPGGYLKKPRYVLALLRHRPIIVTLGSTHAASVPRWLPAGGRAVIPYGLDAAFRSGRTAGSPPAPRAVFTSNPLRGLDWLLDLWARRIHPAMPAAELHLYCGPAVYPGIAAEKAQAMAAVLARADALAGCGVRRHAPLPHAALAERLPEMRVMLYRGDPGETFCLAVAEAQALGLPAVVGRLGSLPERVRDGVTGTVAADDESFAEAALALLGEDALWLRQHAAALAERRGESWDAIAERFAALIG